MKTKLTVLDLFSGIGGFSLGLERAGMKTVAFCEIEEYPRQILQKHWPDVPVYNDIRTLKGEQLGTIDVICGGFPCQDLSGAGKQKGLKGERSSLYTEMLRLISECRPKYTIFENVTALLTGEHGRWFAKFLYDLAEIGQDAEWHCIPASEFGTTHHRDRIWIIAYPHGTNEQGLNFSQPLCTYSEGSRRRELARTIDAFIPADAYIRWRGKNDEVPREMDRLKGLGNSVLPDIPELIGKAILAC